MYQRHENERERERDILYIKHSHNKMSTFNRVTAMPLFELLLPRLVTTASLLQTRPICSTLIKRGILLSKEIVCTPLYVAGTMRSVLIKGGALISGVI